MLVENFFHPRVSTFGCHSISARTNASRVRSTYYRKYIPFKNNHVHKLTCFNSGVTFVFITYGADTLFRRCIFLFGCPGRRSRDPGHAKIKPCTYPVEQCCWSRSQSAMGAAPTCEPPSGSGLRTGQVSMKKRVVERRPIQTTCKFVQI